MPKFDHLHSINGIDTYHVKNDDLKLNLSCVSGSKHFDDSVLAEKQIKTSVNKGKRGRKRRKKKGKK